VRLLRFDGCQQGDEVHLELGFWPLRQSWVSLITSQQTSTEKIVFVDEGQRLPFFSALLASRTPVGTAERPHNNH
jgi:hypothetical protein